MRNASFLFALLVLFASVGFSQTALDQRPAGAPALSENVFEQRAREAKERLLADSKANEAKYKKLGAVCVSGKVVSVLKDGSLLVKGLREVPQEDPISFLDGKPARAPRSLVRLSIAATTIVQILPAAELGSRVAGESVNVLAVPTGDSFRYEAASGSASTVRVYTIQPMP